MKIASMNIQNLYHRDLSFKKASHARNLQSWMEEFQKLMDLPKKDNQTLERLRELSFSLGFGPACRGSRMALRSKGGLHYIKATDQGRGTMASERLAWNGWMQLGSFALDQRMRKPKLDCIVLVAPDILILQEVEDRQSLADFNREHLAPLLDGGFDQWLFVEGNDPRGLGHGILLRNGYTILGIRTHAHDRLGPDADLFEMESPEFIVGNPKGEEMTLISTRFQEDTESDQREKRKAQSLMLRSSWERLRDQGKKKMLICGNLGEVAYGKSLAPLLGRRDLRDISQHPYFDPGKGTNGPRTLAASSGQWMAKHDYLLASPDLYARIQSCGMKWPLEKGTTEFKGSKNALREPTDTLSSPIPPLLWVEIEDV